MARKSNLSADDISAQDEMKSYQQKEQRKAGFSLMSVRDSGVGRTKFATVFWHTDNPPTQYIETGRGVMEVTAGTVPEGKFGIEFDGKTVLFDAEELRKYLRWA